MDLERLRAPWTAPETEEDIPQGDMPGDRVVIGQEHIRKARVLFPLLKDMAADCLERSACQRAVIAVCGGSGVGKSGIASLLGYYFRKMGVGAYVLSGDNYPRRVPRENDAERLRVFRTGGLRGLVTSGNYRPEMRGELNALWALDVDSDPRQAQGKPWLEIYQRCGRCALADYLGSEQEIDFAEMSEVASAFKLGAPALYLKRMGRETTELWYDEVDMSGVHVLIIEWTHGNSDHFRGVDIPVLLNSTPAETLAYRRARGRDKGVDSPFVAMVLELEQEMLVKQAPKAKIILSKSGRVMTLAECRQAML